MNKKDFIDLISDKAGLTAYPAHFGNELKCN